MDPMRNTPRSLQNAVFPESMLKSFWAVSPLILFLPLKKTQDFCLPKYLQNLPTALT